MLFRLDHLFSEAAEKSHPKYYASLDYFLPWNIKDSLEEAHLDINDIVISEGGKPHASKTSSGGIGGRFGLLIPVPGFQGFWFGGNLGYVVGPNAKITVNDPTDPSGSITYKIENNYLRALLEIAHIAELSKKIAFKFDVGAGLGKAKTKQTAKFEGKYADLFDDFEYSKSSTKFTWEVSPALILSGERFDLEFGARYAQFPKIKESDDTYKVNYSGFGFYAGIGF